MGKMKFYLLLPVFAVLVSGSVSFAQNLDMEALKAELRDELKAELKSELMAELKNETKTEVQEAAIGLRDVLKADFRDEIRSEIMQETVARRDAGYPCATLLGGMFNGTTVGGFIDVNYMYNFRNHGEGDGAQTGSLSGVGENDNDRINFIGENEDNMFVLENFALFLDKECTDEHPIGWQMHTYWGEKAKRITFAGDRAGDNGNGGRISGTDDTARNDLFTIVTANISWNAPVFGKHVKFTMGKIYTWIGYELVENIGNPNYTHGTVYNNAIPFTHMGISADVSEFLPSDKWGLTLYGVNGWDSFIDNNKGKSFGAYLTYQPNDDFFISLAGIWGPEGWGAPSGPPGTAGFRDDINDDDTMMYDIVITYSLPQVDKLSLGFNFDHGFVENAGITGGSDAHWWAAVGYLMYDFTDNQQGAFRYEYFDDSDGAKLFGQTMWTATYTHNITVHDNLLIRPEIRYNKYNGGANNEIASGGNGANLADDEVIFAFGTEYVF